MEKLKDKIIEFFKSLNKNELIVGAVFGAVLSLFTGPIGLLAVPFISVLWAIGGSGEGRAFRYIGVPAVGFVFLPHTLAYIIGSVVAGALLTIGYGIPTIAPGRPDHDEGSTLGAFYYKLFKGNEKLANIFTRGTLYAGMFLAYFLASLF